MTPPFWAAALAREDGSPADGVNLLWTAPYAAGYSLTGYDIQRRKSSWKPNRSCYTLTGVDLELLHRVLRLFTSVAAVAVNHVSCPNAPVAPPDDPFNGDTSGEGKPSTLTCANFSKLPKRRSNSIDTIEGLVITAYGPRGAAQPTVLDTMGGLRGVDCAYRLDIDLPTPSRRVVATLMSFAQPAKLSALEAHGSVVATGVTPVASKRQETITLRGAGITRVRIEAPADETLLLEFCWESKTRATDVKAAEATPGAASLMTAAANTNIRAQSSVAPSSLGSRNGTCLRYDIRLDGSHQFVQVVAQVPAMLAIAMHQEKAVDSKVLANANGVQRVDFVGRSVDQVLLYTSQQVSGLTICVEETQTPDEEATDWTGVPYIAQGIQLPVQSVNSALVSANDELTLARLRLIAGETLDAAVFTNVSATLNATSSAGPASPMWYTLRTRERLQDPFIDIRPWPYALAMTLDAVWRRALGFGYLDPGNGLTSGTRYDYRITGHFLRRDIEEQLFAFHTIPSNTVLPATFHLGPVRLTSDETVMVELYPDVPETALQGTSRKGIALSAASRITLAFDTAVTRVVLEMEPAVAGTLNYEGKTSDYYFGSSGSSYAGAITAADRVTLDFAQPIDTFELRGTGFLYGVRLPSSTDDPNDVLDRAVVLPSVLYAATGAPAPPPALGTTNLQQPIIPVDPAVTTQVAPQPMGFTLQWVPPPPGGGTVAPWPTDLGAVPPFDVTAFLLERRRVDTAGAFAPVGQQTRPTLYFGNRGARSDPPPLYFGIDALVAFPEVPPTKAPVDPWIRVDDVLLSAANPGGPPPGSTHQYRVYSVDAIGRRSTAPTTGSIVRLEKHIAPPRPPGPEAEPLDVYDPAKDMWTTKAGTVRPAGVRARVIQKTDPDLPAADVALLGASLNAIVLEWGWTADDRARDPYATEFRVYWQSLCPDLVRGTLIAPATLAGSTYQMACTLDQAVTADAMEGKYFLAPDYPFKVAGHDAGTSITMQFEQSTLDPSRVPGAAEIAFTPMLRGTELRPSAWEERTAVVAIGPGPVDPAPYIFRDRLTLDATHPIARVWVGVSSADAQSYIPDELPAAAMNGGRPGNESSIAPVVVEARYLGQPTFVVTPPLPDIPEDVSPEPVGPFVSVNVNLPAYLPGVAIPAGCSVIVDRLTIGALASALSQLSDGTIGVQFPDETTASYALPNAADQAALRKEIATGEPAQVENRFLMEVLLNHSAQFEALWQRALPLGVPFAAITDRLPSQADRWLYRVRLSDEAGHVSQGAAIVPRIIRVASTRTPGAPPLTVPSSTNDSLIVTGRLRQAFDLKWLVLFTLVTPDQDPLDSRVRQKAQLLRIPNRRDLYPMNGLRLRLADGTLLSPAAAVDVVAAGTLAIPDVVVFKTLTLGYSKRVSVWAVTLTRDGIPSRYTGPATAHTGTEPLVVPAMGVTAAGGIDTVSWSLIAVPAEISVERTTDGGTTWTRVSPWLPLTATTYAVPGTGTRQYRLALRGTRGQPTATGNAVTPM